MIMNTDMILPAEWAPQQAIQLTWPHEDTDWREYLADVEQAYIADAITKHESLIIVTPHADKVKALLHLHLSNCQMQKVKFNECPTNDTWARDHGFITLRDREGQLALLDFKFNGWGNKFASDLDNAINKSLYDNNMVKGQYINLDDFVLEGGSIESDGCGTIFTTTCCLLAPHRNQPLAKQEISERLKKELHAERVLWIDHGHLEGDDTDGHIDTLVRIAPDNTLVYVGCDDPTDSHYAELKAMEKQLTSFKTKEGKPYRLLKLPMVAPMYDKGERLPATYANFIILNDAVIYPTYNQPSNDKKAATIIQQAFPDRELIPIDSSTIVRQHGSLHCCTMQYPQ